MSQALLQNLSRHDLAVHVRMAMSTPSGRILKELLRLHSFMVPKLETPEWSSPDQLAFRYGRLTLFQLLEALEQFGLEPKPEEIE